MNKKMLGVLVDCSRNGVLSVEGAKRYIDCLEKMGYNTLLLYTEDTYEADGQPYFGYLRGKYTKEELREIDKYAICHNIELVPCMQTLAHLGAIFRWPEYERINDTGDILLAGEEETLALIDSLFASLRSCFSSDKIHIGMDEAHMLGLGKYLDKHGFHPRQELFLSHLRDVCKLAQKYGFKPIAWSDMPFRLANGNKSSCISDEDAEKIKKLLPENITLMHYDYCSETEDKYILPLENHKKLCDNIAFAGGIWTWVSIAPDHKHAFQVTEKAMEACRKCGVNDFLVTAWGDDGCECSPISALPSLMFAAEAYRGNTDMKNIAQKFEKLFGENFETVKSLEEINIELKNGGYDTSTKVTLYSDVLLGQFDPLIADNSAEQYAALEEKYNKLINETDMFKVNFKCFAALAKTLKYKSRIGIELREAYQNGDRQELERIVSDDIPEAVKATREFLDAYRECWLSERKPQGLEVIEIRIAAVIIRLESAEKRVRDYLSGKIDRIEELDEKLLTVYPGNARWYKVASTNNIYL